MGQDHTEVQFNASVARMLHREALRRAALETNTTSTLGLEGMLARISAEATAEAAERISLHPVAAPVSNGSVSDVGGLSNGESTPPDGSRD